MPVPTVDLGDAAGTRAALRRGAVLLRVAGLAALHTAVLPHLPGCLGPGRHGAAEWTFEEETAPGLAVLLSPLAGGSLSVDLGAGFEPVPIPAGCVLLLAGRQWPGLARTPALARHASAARASWHAVHLHLDAAEVMPEAGFCASGMGMDMGMQGFFSAFFGPAEQGCVIFLHPSLVATSAGGFAVGLVATAALGVATEGLFAARRKVKGHAFFALYVVQLLATYLLMLLAMTYCYEVFLAVLAGLVAGHAVFGDRRSAGAQTCLVCRAADLSHTLSAVGTLQLDGGGLPLLGGASVALEVQGMTCAACVHTVQTALAALPSVDAAVVCLESQRADVRLHRDCDVGSLVQAVEAVGFTARPVAR